MNLLHSCKICHLDSIGYKLHGQANVPPGKNLSQYLLIGAWLMMALVALVQRELEWPKYWSQGPSLITDSSRGFELSLKSSRKFLPFRFDTWKDIFHCEIIESQSYFLQKSQDYLYGKIGDKLKLLVSLFTKECSSQFWLLGQSQNLMWLLLSFLKNSLSSQEIAAEWTWYGYNDDSKILLAVCKESMMMTIYLILGISTA